MVNEVLSELKADMQKVIEKLKGELTRVRTGRANLAMLDSIRVDYYGVPTPLAQMATIAVPDARLLTVRAWERTQVKAIDKAIRESELGLNPQVDGELIRIPIPALTEERRKEMVKQTKRHGEEGKVAIRKHRRDALALLTELADEGEVSEDDAERARKKVEDLITERNKEIDRIVTEREKDIMEV
jgi:ribosome recycling factor